MMPFSYLLFNDKARNTIDENIFRLYGVQTLSTLVEQINRKLNKLQGARREKGAGRERGGEW